LGFSINVDWFIFAKTDIMGLGYLMNLLEIVLFLVAAYFIVRLIVKAYLKNEEKKRKAGILLQNQQVVFPLKLQACERLILYLERISPGQLISRTLQPGISAGGLHLSMIQAIREEFEHNVAQQVYISANAWSLIRNAKEGLLVLINKKASELNPDATGHELAKIVLEQWGLLDNNPIQTAIDELRDEIQSNLS